MEAALSAEARAHREEANRREWDEKDLYLTEEQIAAGESCRGCGLQVVDGLGRWPGTMYLSDAERVEYDAVEARFKEMHPDCQSHRWSMSGSRTPHCGCCCPPPLIPKDRLEAIDEILRNSKTREEDLDVWECTLTCGHTVKRSVHHTTPRPYFSTVPCSDCEVTRGVVSSVKVMTVAERKMEAERERKAQVLKAEREVARAEKTLRDAQRKLTRMSDHQDL